MSLIKDIRKNTPFRNSHEKAMVNIIFTHNYLKSKIDNFMKGFGVTTKQFNLLRILKGASKPVSTNFIKDRLLDKMSDASRLVKRLEEKGFVHRQPCEKDKRLVDVSISQHGRVLLDKIEVNLHELDHEMRGLSSEEADALCLLLDKIRV